jgi:methanethiol S-methyltransferase
MILNHIILAALWILYCVLHSVFASIGFKKKVQLLLQDRYKHYRLFYTLFAFTGLALLTWFQIETRTISLFQSTGLTHAIGIILSVAGLLLMLLCIKKYFMSLSGLKSLFDDRPTSELIITGVHRYVRHPLYLGTFIFLWGSVLVFPLLSWMIAVLIITLYTIIAIKYEEDKLVLEYGDQYKRYQQSVPKLLPWLSSNV